MEELMRKYAQVLLQTCLKLEEEQPLFISYNVERIDFARIVAEEAFKYGVKDIFFDITDPYLKHEALKHLDVEELKELSFWNKEIWNVYAERNAAFLMLASENPGLMKDIDSDKITQMTKYSYETRKVFDAKRDKSELAWCIAAVPTEDWAKELFPESQTPVEDLWNKIFEICSINQDDPVEIWNKKLEKLKSRAKKLNEKHIKTLIYSSSNGTDFRIDLNENHVWASGCETLSNGKEVLVNFPTEEVFTSPDCKSANGIVYSSKPLSYQDVVIDKFNIIFKDGKAVDCQAEQGLDTLKSMINICENSDMLGEVALVPYDSPISNTNQVFLETLYDENAACHLALGDSFTECIKDGPSIDKDELFKNFNMNKCDSHVDFMIGTKDLSIKAITANNEEITIFQNGNFAEEFN